MCRSYIDVYSTGSNAFGQLAQGSVGDSHYFRRCLFDGVEGAEVADQGRLIGSKILSIAAGANHTLLLLRSQEGRTLLWGCGDGRRGQLGRACIQEFGGVSSIFRSIHPIHDTSRSPDRDITLIAASWETSFVVLSGSDNDILLSVGGDDFGDLGVGGLSEGLKETGVWQLVDFRHLLPKNAAQFRISQLRAGPHNILAKLLYHDQSMREVEVIVGWGAGRHGQLGSNHASIKPQTIVNSPRSFNLPSPITDFATGSQHTVFLTSEGTVVPFGTNRKGQVSGLDAVQNIYTIAATWNGTYILQRTEDTGEKWDVLATGSNSHGQLTLQSTSDASTGTATTQLHRVHLPANVSEARSLTITCGSEHVLLTSQTAAQVNDGEMDVFAWGWNEHGNLGLGHTSDVHRPARIWPLEYQGKLRKVVGVWAGCATSWIAVTDG